MSPQPASHDDNALSPIRPFRFQVDFREALLGAAAGGESVPLCSGAFSQCSGLEASMEPKAIPEGGRNWGVAQRAGPVTFSTVVLRRGMTSTQHLWKWFELVGGQAYAYRLTATVTVFDTEGQGVLGWELERALPVKFKTADLDARATDVAVEELHLAHEGMRAVKPAVDSLFHT